ncbi:MAG: 2Fe-2S iron-sulfur cluster binding domain-containing protein, partial [Sandaracinaceae bacterium]|nr:2Fe-2S iron-sulfur cluster binding domain-containing protein [Sandaracinaceae bacterium]
HHRELPRTYYLCGPLAMMDAAREELRPRGAVEVALWVRGRSAKVSVEPGQTLLEAGLAAGLPMPFSCAMGGCGACKGRLVEGAVHLEEPNCLSERERAQGLVLPCIARPEAPSVVEVA